MALPLAMLAGGGGGISGGPSETSSGGGGGASNFGDVTFGTSGQATNINMLIIGAALVVGLLIFKKG